MKIITCNSNIPLAQAIAENIGIKSKLVIDTETGGISPRRDALLQIGAVITNTNTYQEEDTYSVLIKPSPSLAVKAEALAVNGLTKEKIDKGVTEKQAIEGLVKFIAKFSYRGYWPIIVGWNIHFDVSFLKWAFRRSNFNWNGRDYKAMDVRALWVYYNLVNKGSANYGGITHAVKELLHEDIPHDALADARASLDMMS